MRKYLVIVLGILLIAGISATASAMEADITLGGDIMVRGWYVDNVHHGVPEKTESQAFYTTEASITLDAKVSDNVRGLIQLETTSGVDGYTGEFIWGQTGYDFKPDADLRFRQLWIQYTGSGLLGVPAGIKVGHMPLALGEKQFLNNERFGDDAILLWVDPTKEIHLAGAIAKLNEGLYDEHRDDIDGYVLLATYALDKDNTIGINWTYIHADDECPSVGEVEDIDFHNLGIHGNGSVSGLMWAAEADIQFGGADGVVSLGGADRDAKGWAVLASLGYMVDPINLRAKFAYGSGDDDYFDEDCEE
ncbi:MAG TPA: hypothetical protein EYP60_06995, partial [bacterium (Candidatus Stahlbacteria)]|nr:hypothetical protein [Candidatus Stahlbacteria bacterium]